MNSHKAYRILFLSSAAFIACNENHSVPSKELIGDLHLKRGEIISCGPPGKEFGTINFEMSCSKETQNDFNVAVELLHSFEYDEAEKMFAKIIDESPGCAMAYWGIAMCNYHPLWEPPTETDLKKGSMAIAIAETINKKSERESGFINAIAAYYEDWSKTDPRARSLRFEKKMEQLHNKYPDDTEAAIFYALALDAAADATDKSYSNQKKAGAILEALYKKQPNHPGIIHYIIHTYDYPEIAAFALPAARRYAEIAPSSAHALHMPSHIFTRMGMWDDCINSNLKSVASANCYAQSAGIKGHWDEELHGLDYLIYAYLQKGDNNAANKQLHYIGSIQKVYPVNFKVAYTFAASPSRAALENKNWTKAAGLQLHPADFPWQKFPWQEAIVHFTRLLGAVHKTDIPAAQSELKRLNVLHDTLQKQKDLYKSTQVAIQIKTGEAWILFIKGKKTAALGLMKAAADMEDSTSKHPVTPGEVLPSRELYADMLLQMQQNENALLAYEEVLQKSPNRFNSLYGAGLAAEKSGLIDKAVLYYKQLFSIANSNSNRPELSVARAFLSTHSPGFQLE
jgi:tetratricopeptide (TPR) repeat protein